MTYTVCLLCRRPKKKDDFAPCRPCLMYLFRLEAGGAKEYANHLVALACNRLDAMEARW